MDFDDDVIPLPDSSGSLDLSSRSWTRIDPTVWGMGRLLLDLNLSYNRIFDIPSEVGNLEMLKWYSRSTHTRWLLNFRYDLRVLRLSFNKIVKLPPAIGKLKRLRELHANGNDIKTIPQDLGNLQLLEVRTDYLKLQLCSTSIMWIGADTFREFTWRAAFDFDSSEFT